MLHLGDALPALPRSIDSLYLDFETSSRDTKLDSLNPWHSCYAHLACVTWDSAPGSYCIPCADGIPWREWLIDAIGRSRQWVNHNVKYDAHVYQRHVAQLPRAMRLVDTVVASKLIDSNRGFGRGTYSLDSLSGSWLHADITKYEQSLKPYLHENQDYGRIPWDVLSEYGGQDVITNRMLHRYVDERMPDDVRPVWETEIRLTRVLLDMETRGVRVDPMQLRKAELVLLAQMIQLQEKIAAVVGRAVRPHVNEDCYEVLVQQYGLPVLLYTNADDKDEDAVHNPSFSKDALAMYLVYPGAPVQLVRDMLACRKINTLLNNFVVPYQTLHVDNIMHANHNQCVRTGRLACSAPNMQQLSKAAKKLILPHHGEGFMSVDASQIEFRCIAHYIEDRRVIDAYNADPDTDYHQWVADMCGIKRRPAKTVNFSMAFGQGKKKTVKQLSVNEDIVADIQNKIEELVGSGELSRGQAHAAFDAMTTRRGESIYEQYHDALPGVKRTAKQAERAAKQRGYVRNIAGRRRHIPADRAHIAFNTVNQGSAADIVKAGMVALHEACQDTGLHMLLNVHDEVVLGGAPEIIHSPSIQRDVVAILEEPRFPLSVPIRWCVASVDTSWGDMPEQQPVKYDRNEARMLASLRNTCTA